MPFEEKRGCGYRKPGRMYLVGSGMPVECDNMPLFLEPCECCGFIPEFYRGLKMIPKNYIVQLGFDHQGKCDCLPDCPICYPGNNQNIRYGIMWVGSSYYTPREFVKEALKMGVSKAIPYIPQGLEYGKTWVILAHPQVKDPDDPEYLGELEYYENARNGGLVQNANRPVKEPEIPKRSGIIFAFIPRGVEMPIWKRDATPEKLKELKDKGITPIIWDKTDPNSIDHWEGE